MIIPLSVDIINSKAPYEVSRGETVFSYCFTTDYNVDYSIDFIEDDLISSNESYQLIIANLNNKKSPKDNKIKDTLLAIVEEFFNKNISTLLYICETGDNKQSMRSRLFEYWFSSYSHKAIYTMLSSSIVDEEGVINYATLIIRNDNPKLVQVITEFSESVSLLSQKP
jgi:hypothetical protein